MLSQLDNFVKKINLGYLINCSVFKNFLGMAGTCHGNTFTSTKCFELFFKYFVFVVAEEIPVDLLLICYS